MSKAHAEAEAKAEAEREVAAADMQAKRKDLKARETALKLALREARPKRRSAFSGGGASSSSSSSSGGSSGGGAEAEAAEDAAVAVKAVLTVARGQLRELKRKRDRVKQQGQGMSKKLKGAREAGRRVDELEREVVGLREDVASARAAAVLPVGREKELFNFTRDPSKRGAPFHPFFAEVIAPAMLTTGASGEQITEILRLSELRYFEPGKGPSEPPGPAWWQDQRHVGGGMSDAYAWYRIATAESATQGGCDETKINRLSRLNLWLARHDKDCEREVYNMGTCKVLIDGTAEGVRECVEIMFKRGQIIVIRLRSLLAAAGHNPDDYIPLVDGGCLLHMLRALMHDTCNAANAAARAIIAAKVRAGEEHFGAEVWAALPESTRETFDGGYHNHTMQLPWAEYDRMVKEWIKGNGLIRDFADRRRRGESESCCPLYT